VTLAYVFFIHLMVVCPLIRLLSISMKSGATRRWPPSRDLAAV